MEPVEALDLALLRCWLRLRFLRLLDGLVRHGDAAYELRPDDATVALALGQWCLKVAGVSFVERGLARAIFGGSPPESTYAEALKFFRKAQELKPASKTKALIKLVEGKMRSGGK